MQKASATPIIVFVKKGVSEVHCGTVLYDLAPVSSPRCDVLVHLMLRMIEPNDCEPHALHADIAANSGFYTLARATNASLSVQRRSAAASSWPGRLTVPGARSAK